MIWYDMIWYDTTYNSIMWTITCHIVVEKIATWNPHACEVFDDACGLPTKCMSVCDRACQTAYTHDNLHGTPRNHRAMPRHSLGPATAQVAPPILLWANSTVKNQKPKATLPIKHSILLSATWCFLPSTCFEKFENILEKICFEDARTVLLERLRIWLMFPTVQWITGSCTTTVSTLRELSEDHSSLGSLDFRSKTSQPPIYDCCPSPFEGKHPSIYDNNNNNNQSPKTITPPTPIQPTTPTRTPQTTPQTKS